MDVTATSDALIEENLFAYQFQDLAAATRMQHPGLFKRALRLHQLRGVRNFGLTQNLQYALMRKIRANPDDFSNIMSSVFELLINFSEQLLRYPKGPERARAARKMMGSALDEKRLQKKNVTCKKSCSACCHHALPYASHSEVDLILEYVAANSLTIDVERLKKQVTVKDSFEHIKNLSWEDSACVFLSAEGSCSIYPVRPLTCMKHLVLSDPKGCDARNNKTCRVLLLQNEKAEILASAFFNIETPPDRDGSLSLPELLFEKFADK